MRQGLFLFLTFIFWINTAWAKNCEERQGTLDFGSGTTKAMAAVVDVCQKKVVKVIYEERLPLALNEALEKNSNNEIPEEIITNALPLFKSVVTKMRDLQVEKISAVATSVFRVAKNGQVLAQRISGEIRVPLRIISQEREAELGYWSALWGQEGDTTSTIVWDIGGGSMQMYARQNGKVHLFKGDMASVAFKNKILEVLQFRDPKLFSSPNPIGHNREAAIQIAKNHAYMNVPSFFKKKAPTARWIGVGGVLSMSVQRQTKKGAKEFTQEELSEALKSRVYLRDAEIDSDYRVSDISNMALVLGYMEALKIQKVETVQASLGQGLLLQKLHESK